MGFRRFAGAASPHHVPGVGGQKVSVGRIDQLPKMAPAPWSEGILRRVSKKFRFPLSCLVPRVTPSWLSPIYRGHHSSRLA